MIVSRLSLMMSLRSTAKRLYGAAPFKKTIFAGLRKVWHPPERIYQHLHFRGLIRVPLDDPACSVVLEHRGAISENQLFWAGLDGWYERTSMRLWLKLARQARGIADVGANSGFYALAASAVNPATKIVAFEPVSETFAWLEANIKANNAGVMAEPLALSNANGTAEIWLDAPHSHYGPSLHEARHRSHDEGVRIEISTCRLDDYLQQQCIDSLDLVKIDVERHEPEVLQGMRCVLQQSKPSLLIEVLDDETGKRIQKELDGLGYLYFNIHEPSGRVRQVNQITKSDSLNYLIVQPAQSSIARGII